MGVAGAGGAGCVGGVGRAGAPDGRLPALRLRTALRFRIPLVGTVGMMFWGGAGGPAVGGTVVGAGEAVGVGSVAGGCATTAESVAGPAVLAGAVASMVTVGCVGGVGCAGWAGCSAAVAGSVAGVAAVSTVTGLAEGLALGKLIILSGLVGGMTGLVGTGAGVLAATVDFGPCFTRSLSASVCSGSSTFNWLVIPVKPSSLQRSTSTLLSRFSSLAKAKTRTFLSLLGLSVFSLVCGFDKRNSLGGAPSSPRTMPALARVCRIDRSRPEYVLF